MLRRWRTTLAKIDVFPPDVSDPPFALPARRGGRGAKAKGNGFEREVVRLLQAMGIAAERVPLSGACKTPRFDHDITCPVRGVDRRLECKRRARAFATIDKMLSSNYALVIRDDRSRPMVVMTLENFADLVR
jgi:hypothetical protein